MDIRLLGPIEVWESDNRISLGGPRTRAVLATLALSAGKVVQIDHIIEVVWGLDAPETAVGQVHTSVWRLRTVLGEVIETRQAGYRLRLDHDTIDINVFEEHLREGRSAAAQRRTNTAVLEFEAALGLWRGEALGGVSGLAGEAARLEERRLGAQEDLLQVQLDLGHHAELVSELNALAATHPLRERLHGQLITALYRSGRSAEALQTYRQLRDRLADDLGLEPSSELRLLQQQVLEQEPTLSWPQSSAGTASTDMGPVPETRYTMSGGIHIAYQVLGDGDLDVILVPGILSHLDLWWESAATAAFLRRLASFGRLIMFDKRGTGLSDRPSHEQTLEDRMDDIRAVMDAAGSERAVLFGYSEGGPMSMLFAATYPQRVISMVLTGASARWAPADDYPCGQSSEHMLQALEQICEVEWGQGKTLEWYAPSRAGCVESRELVARRERISVSPSEYLRMLQLVREIDVRAILPTLSLPVLIAQRLDDRVTPPCHGRFLAEHLPNARYVEQPGDHVIWLDDADWFFTALQSFLTGEPDEASAEQVLVTVLEAEMSSGGGSVDVGQALSEVLDVQPMVVRSRGRVLDAGPRTVLATFDGPTRALQCAVALQSEANRLGLGIRMGVHVGEASSVSGRPTTGVQAVADRVCAHDRPGEILVTRTVKDLTAGSGFVFRERGRHTLQGTGDLWPVYAVSPPRRT